jgi:asparagine synthase (glutamine-hydrolysing)
MTRTLTGFGGAPVCGISGFLSLADQRADAEIVRRMTAMLRHRGPDDEGFYVAGPVALGHRRLRIIDLETGRQPIANETGTVQVILNGEIYNFAEVRTRLQEKGHRFRTRSDTEVIVHAYEEFGEECVAHFNGMFAFALWDEERETLFLARDRMGEKPLYYTEQAGWFVFGSELRAVLEHPVVGRELDLLSFSRYLTNGYVPDPHTIFRNIHKLSPGHFLSVTSGKARLVRYWDIEFHPGRQQSEDEWAGLVWTELCQSVRRRLVSDVPVGIFLSGGVDSAAIVAAAASVAPSARLTTFSMGFEEASYDETPYARAVAERFGTHHEQVMFTSDVARAEIPGLGQLLDEPLADPSFLPTVILARHARQTVTVTLGGDGGDELWGGYPTFLAVPSAAWIGRLPRPLLDAAVRFVERLPSSAQYGSIDFLLKLFVRGLGYPPDVQAQILMGGFTRPEQARLLARPVQVACGQFNPYDDIDDIMAGVATTNPVDRLSYHHCKLYLAGRTLVKMDRATMAVGLEARAPFLDHTFVEFACSVPARLKVKRWTTKYLLKQALAERVPETILRRRKQGFGVPIGRWLREPLRPLLEDALHRDRLRRVGLFSADEVGRLVHEHLTGAQNHQRSLWTLLTFELWREAYLSGNAWT